MTFSYTAGSATPDYAGLIEWPSLRLVSDGTFRPLVIPPLVQSAPLRVTQNPVPRGGGFVSDPLLDVWQFDVAGWLLVDDVADVQAAVDYLRDKVNTYKGWQTVSVRGDGWAAARTMSLRLAGQVDVTVPDKGDMTSPERGFTVPVIAADPRQYGPAATTTITGGGVNLTNNGNTPAPITVKFNGARTNPRIDGPGAAGTNRIRVAATITSGHWIEVGFDPTTGVVYAVDDLGVDRYADVTADTAFALNPGTSSWSSTSDSGAGTISITVSDAWA